MIEKNDPLEHFHPLIKKWFLTKLGKPTDIQDQAWPVIAEDKHILISAPTGSGKTMAAFLWAINQLFMDKIYQGNVRVLYISPLKALNNDIQKNLLTPLTELKYIFEENHLPVPDIRVHTRSGDTPHHERQKMLRRPPEILITTPETLNILLSSRNSRMILTGLHTVILDEIHAVVGNKRGTHLITAIERLIPLCGEFQRIGLSATVKPMDKVADFIGGFKLISKGADPYYEKRNVEIICSKNTKKYKIKVDFPDNARENMKDDSWWPVLATEFKKITHQSVSTLFFTNSRRLCEKVTRLINTGEQEMLSYSHHGSLSKEIRLNVEQKLKTGDLKAIVATSSLELGIDIGHLEKVVLIQSPFAISSAIQRVGRAGHNVEDVSTGLIYPTHGRDFVDAAVIARAITSQDIEKIQPVECPLDVLAQVILSMTGVEQWDIDELFLILKTSFPYRNLSRTQYDILLEMLAGRYADSRIRELKPRVSIDKIDNTIKAKDGVLFLVYMAGGTIPDRGYFDLRLADSKVKIGELDEEFVWERSIGETFSLGNQLWRIMRISHNDVEVQPAKGSLNIIPFWKAEALNRDFYFSEKIGNLLEWLNKKINDSKLPEELKKQYHMQENAIHEMLHFLKLQKKATKTDLPHRHHLLIEHYDDPFNKSDSKQVILHTLWGGRVNQPFALALAAAWEEKYKYPLQVIANNDAILLMLPHHFQVQDIFRLILPENLEKYLRNSLERTGFFGARFRENAGRALLLPRAGFKKRMPLWLNRLRAKKLLDTVFNYEDFPILLETWRTCLQDEFELNSLSVLLTEIQEGTIKISEIITKTASPFASNLIWKQTNKYMYEDDTPLSDKKSALNENLLKEMVFSSHLRPKIPEELIVLLDQKLKRTAPGYAPDSAQDLLDWIKERQLIPLPEWELLLEAITRDYNITDIEILSPVKEKIIRLTLPHGLTYICALEKTPDILQALNHTLEKVKNSSLNLENSPVTMTGYLEQNINQSKKTATELLYNLTAQFLSFYGPVPENFIIEMFGIKYDDHEVLKTSLLKTGILIQDEFTQNSENLEICDTKNLETLLRYLRKSRQPDFKPKPLEDLPLFLARYQGLTAQGDSMETLQNCLEQLFGYPTAANAWEEYILPGRLKPYYTAWLDSLMLQSPLLFFGCGKQKLSFSFQDDLELFMENKDKSSNKTHALSKIIPEKGKFSFFDVLTHSGMDSSTLAKKLWQLTWQGKITGDSFVPVRKGILNKFSNPDLKDKKTRPKKIRRSGFNRWKSNIPLQGHWFSIDFPHSVTDENDSLANTELIKDRVRILFKRYGILFRALLDKELPLLKWKKIFKTLRIMELSGEILSGYFFEKIPGLQFISHEAFRMLKEKRDDAPIFWINAADPASLCGIPLPGLKEKLPARLPSTHLIYHGSQLMLISKKNGKELTINTEKDNPHLPEYFSFFKILLTRDFNAMSKIIIEKVNGESALKSPYLEVLKQFGFNNTHKNLEMWRIV